MLSRGFRHPLAAMFAVTVTAGSLATASAAPMTHPGQREAPRHPAPPAVENVHWEWRHHHRVWVPDHHHHHDDR